MEMSSGVVNKHLDPHIVHTLVTSAFEESSWDYSISGVELCIAT